MFTEQGAGRSSVEETAYAELTVELLKVAVHAMMIR
jgi:hypothetical protein